MLGERLRDIYATPEPTLAEVVISSGSISAAADQIELLDQVGQQDASVVNTLRETKLRLQNLRAELLIDEKRAEQVVAQAKAQKDKIESLLAQRAAVLENVKGELAQMIAAEQERQRQIAAMQAAIAQQRQAAAAAASVAAQGGGGSPAVAAPAAGGAPAATAPLPSGGGNAAAVAVAMQQLGTPYVWGGSGPGGFDCSGLASYAYSPDRQERPALHRRDLERLPQGPGQRTLQAGDMVFFNGGGHMGIYIGGGQYVHAPQHGRRREGLQPGRPRRLHGGRSGVAALGRRPSRR